ncbi:MAG: DUF5054 domain-containing protein [Eubacteriales bacterium]|nr:DUF5054 domain-containing protein [Eubacteriales bacterium]
MAVEKVYLVFKTHFDIGFTALAEDVLRYYSGEMLEKVVRTCEDTQRLGDLRYIWTVPSWPLQVMERQCAPELRARMDALEKNGQLVWHALPYTSHYDFTSIEEAIWGLRYARELSQEHGKALCQAGKLTDVPGAGWMLPEILSQAGIRFLHMGCNEFACPPDVPPLFWWEAPSGRRVLTMYNKSGYGTPLCPPEGWPFKAWMALMNTQDNCGPQSAEILEQLLEKVHARYPEAEVVSGTLDDFWNELSRQDLSGLPVVRKDLADTWIHGVGSYPREVAALRRLRRRVRAAEMRCACLPGPERRDVEERIREAYDNLALFGEHTWGLDVKTHLKAIPCYDRDDFARYRKGEACVKMEASWAEQSGRAANALVACEAAEAMLDMPCPPQEALRAEEPCTDRALESAGYRLSFNPETGAIEELFDKKRGCALLAAQDGAGAVHYRYDRYGIEDMTEYLRAYAYRFSGWGVEDNGRIDYPECEHGAYLPVFERCLRRGANTVAMEYRTSAAGQDTGDAQRITLAFTVTDRDVKVRVSLRGKPATPYVESGALVLRLPAQPQAYYINKPGCVLRPETDIADNANHAFYALEYFAAAQSEHALLTAASVDCPLASIGENGVYGFRRRYERREPELRFCLFNNMWGTNFPQWLEGDFDYEFLLFSRDPGDVDGAYAQVCDALEESAPACLSLPEGLRLTRMSREGETVVLHLHNITGGTVRGDVGFAGRKLRREDLLGRVLTDWARECLPVELPAYGVECLRVEL